MKILVMIAIAVIVSNVIAESGMTTQEEKVAFRKLIAKRQKAKIAAEGGMVTKTMKGNYARIVSAQKKVSLKFIREMVRQFNSGLCMWIDVSEIESGKDVWETLDKARSLPKTGLVTLIVDDEKLPRILSAMEDGWSILNIKSLNEDLPPKEVYNERVRKEINRAFAQSAGVGLSFNRPCVMMPAYSLMDLDSIGFPVVSPEAISKIQDACKKRKIERMVTLTYKTACQEGWAPPPTNEIQKAVWDDVHAMPKTPMKIKFDPAAEKGKVTK